MKARISGKRGTMYYGEVLIEGRWKIVTDPCYTKFGARLQLKRWVKAYIGFEIN